MPVQMVMGTKRPGTAGRMSSRRKIRRLNPVYYRSQDGTQIRNEEPTNDPVVSPPIVTNARENDTAAADFMEEQLHMKEKELRKVQQAWKDEQKTVLALRNELQTCQQTLAKRNGELLDLQRRKNSPSTPPHYRNRVEDLKRQHQEDINEKNRVHQDLIMMMRRQHEQDIRDWEEREVKLHTQVELLQSQNRELRQENQKLKDTIHVAPRVNTVSSSKQTPPVTKPVPTTLKRPVTKTPASAVPLDSLGHLQTPPRPSSFLLTRKVNRQCRELESLEQSNALFGFQPRTGRRRQGKLRLVFESPPPSSSPESIESP